MILVTWIISRFNSFKIKVDKLPGIAFLMSTLLVITWKQNIGINNILCVFVILMPTIINNNRILVKRDLPNYYKAI